MASWSQSPPQVSQVKFYLKNILIIDSNTAKFNLRIFLLGTLGKFTIDRKLTNDWNYFKNTLKFSFYYYNSLHYPAVDIK